MIKALYLSRNAHDFPYRYSDNNDGVFGQVQFVKSSDVDLENPQVDYIISNIEYAMDDFTVHCDPNKLWLLLGEPYEFPVDTCFQNRTEFGKVISCLGDTIPNGDFMPICTQSWMDTDTIPQLQTLKPRKKTKSVSWITSKKVYFKGHMQRLKLAHQLQTMGICDLYGNGFEYVENKIDTLADYKYSIAMENTIDGNYITEKPMDCWLAHTLPIYIGSPSITKYFPEKSMIQLDMDDKFLAEKIKDISQSDLHKDRMPYIKEARNIVMDDMNMFKLLANKIQIHHTKNPTGNPKINLVKGVKTSRNIAKKVLYKIYQHYYNYLLIK